MGWQAYRMVAGPLRDLLWGILGSLSVYLGFGLFDSLPFWTKPGFLPWLVFGLVLVCWQLSPARQSIEVAESAPLPGALQTM
jgi:hypothetical protein